MRAGESANLIVEIGSSWCPIKLALSKTSFDGLQSVTVGMTRGDAEKLANDLLYAVEAVTGDRARGKS